jgi:prolyl oligopeptidase
MVTFRSSKMYWMLCMALVSLSAQAAEPDGLRLTYPETNRADQSDDYHGVVVQDPYRWLEDVDSEATKAWVQSQNAVTFDFLRKIPQREAIRQRLTELWNFERYTEPVQRGGRYFYARNDGLQNQSVLYVAESLDGTPRELLDPNRLSEDGTVALAGWEVSDDGRLLAYGLAAAGSDWREWHVRDVASGQDLGDHLKWIKFSSVAWTPDHRGFFYSRYDEPPPGEKFTGANYFQKLFYHRLGDPQDQDRLIYERPDQKEWGFSSRVTDDGQYLVIGVWRGTEPKNQVFYKPLAEPQAEVVELLSGFDAEYEFLGNQGSLFWLLTDLDAPLRRVIAIDVQRPDRSHWKEVIAESEQVIRGASIVGDRFFVSYLKDATTRIEMFDLDGRRLGEVALPGIGTAGGFGGRQSDRQTFYWFTSFTAPVTIFRYEVATGESSVFRRPQLPFDPADYVTEQVFFESRDGTRVPMFLTHRRGARPAGGWQTILYGYGGFDISLTPSFSVSNLVWMERGGLYAVPNLRGGGEYGRRWHEAGMKANKQNVFDDFLAAAQWLIDHGYTTPNRLAIRGGSNGGLLVGAAMTQRPELFGAAIPAVGVMDMLRYHKFTIGWAWVSEFGSSDDPDEFPTLLRYSPLHNLNPGTRYPATMVMTADHDDRVVPGHSFKFAAALQHAHAGDPPVLIRIETSAGHGAGTPTTKLIESAADAQAFLEHVLGKQPSADENGE